MGRDHGEIEFEFVEKTHGGEFLASGKVIQFLRNYLARGEIELAATLLASCNQAVGDEVIREIVDGGASRQTIAALAEMFFKARDFARAARCAVQAGDPAQAAKYLEANYELEEAAEHYLKAGKLEKAADLFERNLTFDRAAELFLKMRDYPRAAENLERAGLYYQAGQLYMKMSRWDKAVDVLQRVGQMEQHFVDSTRLLGRILEESGNQKVAMQHYLDVVRNKPLDGKTLEIHFRLGKLCAEQGLESQAKQLLDGVLGVNPRHPGARDTIALIESGQPIPQVPAPAPGARINTGEIAPMGTAEQATPDRREPGESATGGFDFAPIDPDIYADDEDTDVGRVIDVRATQPSRARYDDEDDLPIGEIREPESVDDDDFVDDDADEDEPAPLDLGTVIKERPKKKQTLVGLDREVDFLRQVDLFKEFSREDLGFVASLCDRAVFRAGDTLIEQGEIGDALYIVVKGEAAVIHSTADGDEKELGRLKQGDYVGELTLLDFTPSTADVVAETNLGAFRIPRKRFQDLLQGKDRIQVRIYRVLVKKLIEKLHQANAKIPNSTVF